MSHPQQDPHGPPTTPWERQGGYPPGKPERRSRAGLWVTLAVVVLLLGGGAFAGWVEPGFFKAKLDTDSRADPQQLTRSFANALIQGDGYAKFFCKHRSQRSHIEEGSLTGHESVTVTTPAHPTGETERAAVVTLDGAPLNLAIAQRDGQWCVRDMALNGDQPAPLKADGTQPGPRPPVKDGDDLVARFTQALNDRDIPATIAFVCAGQPSKRDYIAGDMNDDLTVTAQRRTSTPGGPMADYELQVSFDGAPRTAQVEVAATEPDSPCVYSFDV